MEEWKDIPGYEGIYQASNFGRIRSLDRTVQVKLRGKIIKQQKMNNGYYGVGTNDRKLLTVHRLVAKAFLPNPENKETVNHINGTKDDNRLENLEWATHAENTQHSWRMGLNTPYSHWKGKKFSDDHRRKVSKTLTHRIPRKLILCFLTGIYYDGIADAAKIFELKYGTLKSMLNGACRNKTSLKYV